MEGEAPDILLLATRTGSEAIVQEQLKARAMATYLPRYLVNIRHRGLTARCLFPGYCFVWAYRSAWPTIRSLIGVRDFVRHRSNGNPEVVPASVVNELKARQGPTGYIRIDPRFVVGQSVIVKDRADWSVKYLGMSNEHKARVLMKMLGCDVEMQIFENELIASP